MPLFFFSITDKQASSEMHGIDLESAAKAHLEAMRAAGEILKDIDGTFHSGDWTMRVTDVDGMTVTNIKITVVNNRI